MISHYKLQFIHNTAVRILSEIDIQTDHAQISDRLAATSYENILLNNDRYEAVHHILDGVQVDEDHLSLEIFKTLMATGTVMTNEHKLRYLYSDEVWPSQLAQYHGLASGTSDFETSFERERAEVRIFLDTHTVEPMYLNTRQEIDSISDIVDQTQTRS